MKKVLVVDDQESMCILLERILQRDGHTVKTATSGKEAAQALGKERFDVVLTDFALGSMNGHDVARIAKEAHRETHVILISGVAREVGNADSFLLKEGDVLEQLRSIVNCIGNR